MSHPHTTPNPFDTQVTLHTGERLLASGPCSLWLEALPRHGAMTVPGNQNWLRFRELALALSDGRKYTVMPSRVEHAGGAQQVLIFEIE